MSQEASPRSQRDSVRDRSMIPEFDKPQGRDRKSLAGMSESVKAILAPLLGGKKSYSKVEVDLGRDSGSSTYETVPMGSTSMQRYSIVEASTIAPPFNPPPSNNNIDTHFVETPGTDAITTPTRRMSNTVFGPGPQKSKGKYQETVDESSNSPARTGSPIDPAYALVDNFLPATKPKMKEYDEYITQTAPQLRARVDSILASQPGTEGVPGPNPNGTMDAVDRLRDTVAATIAEENTSSLERDEAPIVGESEEGLPLHPRSSTSSGNSPQGAAIRRRSLPRQSNN